MLSIVLAIFVPCLLVILFTRVTYNHYVGLALTATLLLVSFIKIHTYTWTIMWIDMASMTVGFLYSRKQVLKGKKK
ncbi:DUF2198 family protein [Bacillus sp. HMF5848]|uniref:DUF2198 family protein n=1 Tax=Bacillus sp. HMF5848 TaxID=2495421 RepID=UPI000F7724F7|nr:DUF2198 family protein [Bacillus sp. HMF5848]RSK28582.1 DUF2198 family protein [Bacillus sp. HMF5848]